MENIESISTDQFPLKDKVKMEKIDPTLTDHDPLKENEDHYRQWTNSETKILIKLYKETKPKVGYFEMRHMRHLWEFISNEMRTIYKINASPKHVENKWRVLERLYKKVISNKNRTGRFKKYFEYEDEFNEIYKHKKNTFSEVFSSETEEMTFQNPQTIDHVPENIESPQNTSTSTGEVRKRLRLKKRINCGEELKDIIKSYHNKKLKIENQKLEMRAKYYTSVIEEKRKMRLAREKTNEILEKMIEMNTHI